MRKYSISSKIIGDKGEEVAANFLQEKGFVIEESNKRFGRAEIDLIARKDQLLIFVEVKVRTNQAFGYPETFVTPAQQEHYHLAATEYITEINWPHAIRFDIIALHINNQQSTLTHFEDAF